MPDYGRNHYVPQWYLRRFFAPDSSEMKFYYLDLHPESVTTENGLTYTKKAVRRLGTPNCFYQDDLYTTQFGKDPSKRH